MSDAICGCNNGVVYPLPGGRDILCERCPAGQKLARAGECEHPVEDAFFDAIQDRFVGFCTHCKEEFPAPWPDPKDGAEHVLAKAEKQYLYICDDRVIYHVGMDRYFDIAMMGRAGGWFDNVDGDRRYYAVVDAVPSDQIIRSHSPGTLVVFKDPKLETCPDCKSVRYTCIAGRRICGDCYKVYTP